MSGLLAAVAGFASGVFLRSLFYVSWPVVMFVCIIAALVGTAAWLTKRQVYVLGALFLMCLALGVGRMHLADTPAPDAFTRDLRHRVSYDAVVIADPDVRDANQRVEVRVEQGGDATNMLVVAPREPAVAVGDRVFVAGTLQAPAPFASEDGRVFRYDKYLARDGVRFILNYAYIGVDESAPWYSLPAALARVKHWFLNGLAAVLPEPYSALAGGIVIGGKSGLGPELQQAFVTSGLVQIVVLSGYNVMVVASWMMAFLAFCNFSRRKQVVFGALALVAFVAIAGFSSTALRAMWMALIALYARATSRTYVAGRALLLVVLLMLAWNPLLLVFDPGFGLSVAATAGLIWLAPRIEEWWDLRSPNMHLKLGLRKSEHGFWSNAIATTLAAQVAVLPLLLYDTGLLSWVAVPANIIAMPVVPLAMGLAAFAGVAGALLGGLGLLFALPAYAATAFLITLAQNAANVPFAALQLAPFPFWLVVVAYAALVAIAASKRFSTTDQLRLAKKAFT